MSIQRRSLIAAIATAGVGGCLGRVRSGNGERPSVRDETLRIAVGTSIYDTQLAASLNSGFHDTIGVDVHTVSLGSGAVFEATRRGDADLAFTHARPLEDEFLRDGAGVNRRVVMENEFVLVGPETDPADIASRHDVLEALQAIARTDTTFVSRGDRSGTHLRELELWDAAGIARTSGEWYAELGQGMGETLSYASERGAYLLVDSGTYTLRRDDLSLSIIADTIEDPHADLLANQYALIATNPAKHAHVAYVSAMAYIGYVTGPAGQAMIADHRPNGEQLFEPVAFSNVPRLDEYVPTDWEMTED